MRPIKKVLTVPPNGQISIGKSWAGREVMLETLDENRIVITSGTFVPAHQEAFYTKKAEATLEQFNQWSEKTPAKKTDLKQLGKRLGKKD